MNSCVIDWLFLDILNKVKPYYSLSYILGKENYFSAGFNIKNMFAFQNSQSI